MRMKGSCLQVLTDIVHWDKRGYGTMGTGGKVPICFNSLKYGEKSSKKILKKYKELSKFKLDWIIFIHFRMLYICKASKSRPDIFIH